MKLDTRQVDATIAQEEAARRVWDVIVLGAGPAGAAAAIGCARRGAGVLLIDKATFPRDKVCGSCVSAAALGALDELGVGEAVRATGAAALRELRLAVRGRGATVALPGGVAVSRRVLDALLVRRAIDAGAALLTGVSAGVGDVVDGGRAVTWREGGCERCAVGRVVIVATGLGGRAAEAVDGLGSRAVRGARIGAGTVVNCEAKCKAASGGEYAPGRVHMAVARGGYVGVVRLEDGRLDVAAAFDTALVREAGGCGEAATRVLREAGMAEIDGLDAARWRGTPGLTRRATRVAAERVMLVGDAAGYVEPFTGEGIAWALTSGAAVAPIAMEAAREAARGAAWRDVHERAWRAAHRRLLRGPQRRCRVIARLLRHPWAVGAAVSLLGRAPVLARPLVSAIAGASAMREIDTATAQAVA